MVGASSKLKRAARKILAQTCGSFSWRQSNDLHTPTVSFGSPNYASPPPKPRKSSCHFEVSDIAAEADANTTNNNKDLCAVCLDPLSYSTGSNPGQAIFTAQCSHSFHFGCISSNVRYGSVTCPICRAHWTQLPRDLITCSLHFNQNDPVLQIVDDSIANFRVHRRSFLRSARYDDDDPIDPDHAQNYPRLHLSLLPVPITHPNYNLCLHEITEPNSCHPSQQRITGPSLSATLGQNTFLCASTVSAYLHIKLAHLPATDLVLVASPNGPHLRLMKQSMALVVFSLRPIDRLAIVTYSSAAARAFPLRRMTSNGKRTALQVIDRIFYMGQADPIEGLKKGVKILGDRVHKNPESCILDLSDSPTRSYHRFDIEVPIMIHRFHVGYGFRTSNGFVMQEFEEFLARVLGGAIREIELRIADDARIVRLGELRGGEERMIPLNLSESGHVCVEYRYVEGGVDECIRRGEIMVGMGDKRERRDGIDDVVSLGGRSSSVESWDYHDPFMARRWAKHLHGYRL
ncbi:unnamed protein product [Ilex paraguariensis]|uniref:RING-type domain-containing protein n=1 Tax=Ilex paraguariensis TaxID=185542 RepID=A0ABC8SNM6_9AQUA